MILETAGYFFPKGGKVSDLRRLRQGVRFAKVNI